MAASEVTARTIGVPPLWRIAALVAALVCGVLVVENIFVAAHRVIGWAVAASIVALLLSPVIQLADRHMPRALAILVTFVLVILLAVGLTWLYTSSVLHEVEVMQDRAPGIAQDIERRDDRIGSVATEIGLADQVTELTRRLDERTGSGSDAVRGVALSAPAYFISMILTIFLLIFGPEIVKGFIRQLPSERRQRAADLLAGAAARTQLYVWGSIAQAIVSGVGAWIVAATLGLPAAGLLGLFAGVAALIPYLGIVVGWIPVMVLAFGAASMQQAALTVALAVVLQVGEAWWWRPRVDSRSVHVGPAIPVFVVALGFATYGIGGALYGCAVAVFLLALADQLAPGEDIPTPIADTASA